MQHDARVAQGALKAFVADTLSVLAGAVVEAVVLAVFHLTAVACPVAAAVARALLARSMPFLFVAVGRARGLTAVRARPRREARDRVVVVQQAVSGAYVLFSAALAMPSVVALASWFFGGRVEHARPVLVAIWVGQAKQLPAVHAAEACHAGACAVLALPGVAR